LAAILVAGPESLSHTKRRPGIEAKFEVFEFEWPPGITLVTCLKIRYVGQLSG